MHEKPASKHCVIFGVRCDIHLSGNRPNGDGSTFRISRKMNPIKIKDQIEDVFVVTFKGCDREDFYKDNEIFSIFYGVDSRYNPKKALEDNGFKAQIKCFHWHMNTFNGSYGCLMSHYLLWEQISKKNTDKLFLILEDDASIEDVEDFLEQEICLKELRQKFNIINVNTEGVRGSDAYLISAKACKNMIDAMQKTIYLPADRTIFQGPKWGIHTEPSIRMARPNENQDQKYATPGQGKGKPWIGHAKWVEQRSITTTKNNLAKDNTPNVKELTKPKNNFLELLTKQVDKKNKSCIVALCENFKPTSFSRFLSTFSDYDIFFFNNQSGYDSFKKNSWGNYVNISEEHCIRSGYSGFSYNDRNKVESKALEKAALFMFGLYKKFTKEMYRNIWFIQEDVFFFSEKTLKNIDKRYTKASLVCKNLLRASSIKDKKTLWNLFGENSRERHAVDNLILFYSNLKVFRIRPEMMMSYNSYAEHHNQLFYHEIYLPTYALLNHFTISRPPEMRTISSEPPQNWDIKNIDQTCFFSPMNFEKQKEMRSLLKDQPY